MVSKITHEQRYQSIRRLIRENIEIASNQIKYNAEMGTAMTNSFIKMSRTMSKETPFAYENARKEMMTSAERMRKETLASAEKMKDSFHPDRRSKT